MVGEDTLTSARGPVSAPGRDVAISLRGIGRNYGRTVALRGVDLDILAGEVHGVIGENGAGKSTCLAMLAGRVVPSTGEIRLMGEPLPAGDPRAIRRAGVAAIYQELTIVPHLSTQANVFLGQDIARKGIVREAAMRARFVELCDDMGVRLPTDVPAGSLSVSDQQLVEIMRGLAYSPRVILFDEPTAALAEHERSALHRVIRSLKERGVTVVLISHNLDEVLGLSDTVTVFRSGRLIATRPADKWSKPELVQTMIGRDLERVVRHAGGSGARSAAPVLRVEGVRTRRLRNVALEVHRGEVVGLAGLVGSGRSTLLKALAGSLDDSRGRMWFDGEEVRWPNSVRSARRRGVTMLPEDRKDAGLFHSLSASENISMASLGSTARFGVISKRRMREEAERVSSGMSFSADRLDDVASGLSGGNQQKLLLARAAMCGPTVLLADEPTRGVDIGAKMAVMRKIREMAASGMAVITASSELEDLEILCDRVIVLAGGEVVGHIDRAEEISVSAILQMAFRVEGAA